MKIKITPEFLNGNQMARRRADQLPAPKVTPQALAAFRAGVEGHVKKSRQPMMYTSRGRGFVFYWAPKGGRLLVRVRPAKVNPIAEALARAVKDDRACRYCGKAFPKRGRAIFCTPTHAARFRHEKRMKIRKDRERAVAHLVETKRLDARSVELAQAELRAHRAAMRRQQRARKKKTAQTTAQVDRREAAYKATGGVN